MWVEAHPQLQIIPNSRRENVHRDDRGSIQNLKEIRRWVLRCRQLMWHLRLHRLSGNLQAHEEHRREQGRFLLIAFLNFGQTLSFILASTPPHRTAQLLVPRFRLQLLLHKQNNRTTSWRSRQSLVHQLSSGLQRLLGHRYLLNVLSPALTNIRHLKEASVSSLKKIL